MGSLGFIKKQMQSIKKCPISEQKFRHMGFVSLLWRGLQRNTPTDTRNLMLVLRHSNQKSKNFLHRLTDMNSGPDLPHAQGWGLGAGLHLPVPHATFALLEVGFDLNLSLKRLIWIL